MATQNYHLSKFTSYEKFVIAALAFLQFTIILDFMILSPLGAVLMPLLKVTPSQFGLVVSVYAFSAGISGLLAAGFADKFDRKKLLMFFYAGFVLGTLLCGIANTYAFLLFARMITGLFGGVVGSVVFAITTDLFPLEKRGRVMGFIQTAFAASQVLGLPFGLYLSNHWGWHAPFMLIVVVSLFAGIILILKLKPINDHLHLRIDRNAFHHLLETVSTKRYVRAFAITALLSTGGFMLMPFGSAFSVNNLGIPLEKLPLVYMVTGFGAIFSGPFIGRFADSIGKFPIFLFGSTLSVIMVIIYTQLSITPIGWVMAINAIMFVGISSRMITSQALLSAIPTPASRGSFMAVNSSIQQISGGFASMIAGWIVVEGPHGVLQNFDILGYVVCGSITLTLLQMFYINKEIKQRLGLQPAISP